MSFIRFLRGDVLMIVCLHILCSRICTHCTTLDCGSLKGISDIFCNIISSIKHCRKNFMEILLSVEVLFQIANSKNLILTSIKHWSDTCVGSMSNRYLSSHLSYLKYCSHPVMLPILCATTIHFSGQTLSSCCLNKISFAQANVISSWQNQNLIWSGTLSKVYLHGSVTFCTFEQLYQKFNWLCTWHMFHKILFLYIHQNKWQTIVWAIPICVRMFGIISLVSVDALISVGVVLHYNKMHTLHGQILTFIFHKWIDVYFSILKRKLQICCR